MEAADGDDREQRTLDRLEHAIEHRWDGTLWALQTYGDMIAKSLGRIGGESPLIYPPGNPLFN